MKKKKAGRKRPKQSLQKNRCSFFRKRKEDLTFLREQKIIEKGSERKKSQIPWDFISRLLQIVVLLIELLEKLF